MRYLLLFMFLVAIFALNKRSCHFNGFGGTQGEGPSKTETRNVTGFHAISLDVAGDLTVNIGEFNVVVEGQENILPLLKTDVENGVLHISFEDNVSYSAPLKVSVTLPTLDELTLAGSGDIRTAGDLQSDKMAIDILGSGNVHVDNGHFNNLKCSLSGSGELHLGGSANLADISLSGSGEIIAKEMKINELSADISGSGEIYAQVLQTLKANISGSGDIVYTGSPVVTSNVSGSGEIKGVGAQAPAQ